MLECYRPFQPGHVIMDVEVEHDNSVVLIAKDGENNALLQYTPGEQISIVSKPYMKQIVYEITSDNAVFVDGTCDGKRSTKPKSSIVTNDSGGEIVVHALWAENFYDGVRLTEPLYISPLLTTKDL